MKKYISFILILSFFEISFAVTSTFKPVDPSYKPDTSSVVEVSNMPPILDQDSLPLCYGYAATTMMQRWYCKRKKLDCSQLSAEERISPLSAAAWAHTNGPEQSKMESAYHDGIFLQSGVGMKAILFSSREFQFHTEACYSHDKIANDYNALADGQANKRFDETIERLKGQYNKAKTEANPCLDCLAKEVSKAFRVSYSNDQILKMLKSRNFEAFLHSIFFLDCSSQIKVTQLKPAVGPRVECYPDTKANGIPTVEEYKNQIKSILDTNYPVMIEGTCAYKNNGECLGKHGFVISGYRKACNAKNQCRDVVKIQNSWGKSWQEKNDDGWVDLQTILDNNERASCSLGWIK